MPGLSVDALLATAVLPYNNSGQDYLCMPLNTGMRNYVSRNVILEMREGGMSELRG